MTRHERMRDGFDKLHLGDGRALHIFTEPDSAGPHDHPWNFRATVLVGCYIERVWSEDGSHNEQWRRSGDRFDVPAEHIHEIIALPLGPCVTIVEAGPHERETRFYRPFACGMQSRASNEEWPE